MTFDPTSGTYYASSVGGSETAIYTIDVATGAATHVGSTTDAASVVDIAFDATGQMYAHDLPRSIYRIDKATAAVTYVGDTGLNGAGPWHGMDFCHENDTMYMATYNSINFERTIRTVDLETGLTTSVGTTIPGAGGFAITSPGSQAVGEDPRPGIVRLDANHPNPCIAQTTIEYQTGLAAHVELIVLDMLDRRVRTLHAGFRTAGDHRVTWKGRGDHGERLPGGLYLFRLTVGDDVQSRRLILSR